MPLSPGGVVRPGPNKTNITNKNLNTKYYVKGYASRIQFLFAIVLNLDPGMYISLDRKIQFPVAGKRKAEQG